MISAENLLRVVPGLNGIFLPLVVTNGQIVGTWRKKIAASGVTCEASLSEEPNTAAARTRAEKTQRDFERGVADYARFLELPVRPEPTPNR
ncbi:hypothetical protein E3T35_00760 [Cryobacterium sp. TMT1-2-2]|uniref:hypothetical protein n=1 Tax=Cryobacterium sp. TMT1-2-2 TaxID=1259233 RepID=UPI00106B6FB3|nr:hypothetical protein [Cryobacterium sp. TMT1-2-2]TFD14955.1 hypothetical protein E3T35_00760 [Cryobacterium sp. TMT1-2-2]